MVITHCVEVVYDGLTENQKAQEILAATRIMGWKCTIRQESMAEMKSRLAQGEEKR